MITFVNWRNIFSTNHKRDNDKAEKIFIFQFSRLYSVVVVAGVVGVVVIVVVVEVEFLVEQNLLLLLVLLLWNF